MVRIIDFSSVFEIGFAMGLILGVFAYIPLWERRIEALFKNMKISTEDAKESGAKVPVDIGAIAWAIGMYLNEFKLFVLLSCSVGTVVSLVMLLIGAYLPDAQMSGWWMGFILAVILIPTPVLMAIDWFKSEVAVDDFRDVLRSEEEEDQAGTK